MAGKFLKSQYNLSFEVRLTVHPYYELKCETN
jgi:hypothetical protein